MTDGTELAMQTRCVHCGKEQYALNVHAVSTGDAGCTWCGEKSKPMGYTEYLQALRVQRATGFPQGGVET